MAIHTDSVIVKPLGLWQSKKIILESLGFAKSLESFIDSAFLCLIIWNRFADSALCENIDEFYGLLRSLRSLAMTVREVA